jgi:hypothetical protein
VTDDAILEFAVDCDGTQGWVNIENWTVTTTDDSRGMKFWIDGTPVGYGDNSSGGANSFSGGYFG